MRAINYKFFRLGPLCGGPSEILAWDGQLTRDVIFWCFCCSQQSNLNCVVLGPQTPFFGLSIFLTLLSSVSMHTHMH